MNNLPTGTVTFLFTDIEGSTKLAQQHPDTWELLQERHHAILHAAIEAHNGYVFQVVGDSFAASFHSASDALNAALESQRVLHHEAWTPARAAALLSEALPLSQEVGDAYLIAMCLIGLAGIQQQPLRAAQLLAAAQTTFEASGEIVEPFYHAAQERIENATRAALGEDAFATAWAEGRALTAEQAVEYALKEIGA